MNQPNSNNSWSEWANHILNSTKRFGEEIKELKSDINTLNKDTNNIKTDLVKFTASNKIDVINEHFESLIKALQTQIKTLEETSSKHDKAIEELNNFKLKVVTVGATINILLGIALTVVSTFNGS